ncbi:hypothetical protein Peur_057690 [Populus x canadensis]
MDADKSLKKSIFHQDHQSLSMVTHHFVVRLHSLYLQVTFKEGVYLIWMMTLFSTLFPSSQGQLA